MFLLEQVFLLDSPLELAQIQYCSDELLLAILERVGEGKDLRHCFPVCKKWNRICNEYLSTLNLNCDSAFQFRPENIRKFLIEEELHSYVARKKEHLQGLEIYADAPHILPSQATLLSLLGSLNASRVHSLCLENNLDDGFDIKEPLWKLLPTFNNLKSLQLSSFQFPETLEVSGPGVWLRLTNLVLYAVRLSTTQLEKIMALFPNVEHFKLLSSSFKEQPVSLEARRLSCFSWLGEGKVQLHAVNLEYLEVLGPGHVELSGLRHLEHGEVRNEATFTSAELVSISHIKLLNVSKRQLDFLKSVRVTGTLIARELEFSSISPLLVFCKALIFCWGKIEDELASLQKIAFNLELKSTDEQELEHEMRPILQGIQDFEKKCPSLNRVVIQVEAADNFTLMAKVQTLVANRIRTNHSVVSI